MFGSKRNPHGSARVESKSIDGLKNSDLEAEMNSALAKIERLEEKIEYWETRNFESNAGMTSQMFSGKQKIEDISTEQKILNMRITDLDG